VSDPEAYRRAGVDYATLDLAKRRALEAAAATSGAPKRLGAAFLDASRGEPAAVVTLGALRLGFVLECLGTKSMIARAVEDALGEDHWHAIGYDTVAAAVNDCCCVGALPFVVNAYFATGAASFYEGSRHDSLVAGFAAACTDAGAAWGGGESPTLAGLVAPTQIDLAASAVGLVPEGVAPLLGEELRAGDEIVLVASTGLHANGASLVRELATSLPAGYATRLASGVSLGAAVLAPSALYVGLVEDCLAARLPLHYVSHLTGHGWRKLMRANRAFTYRIEALPEVPEVLAFIAEAASLDAQSAYGTLNMGAGLACFVGDGAAGEVVAAAAARGFSALIAGRVEEGERSVQIDPLGVSFASNELELR